MIVKKYSTVSAHTLLLMVKTPKGRQVACRFKGGSLPDSTGTFSTKEEDVQYAIEHCSLFGREVILKNVIEREDRIAKETVAPSVEEAQPAHDIIDAQEFKSLVACKAAMAEHGIDVTMIRTCSLAEEIAKANGLEYKIKR